MPKNEQPVILIAEDSENDLLMLRRAFSQAGLLIPLQAVADGEEAIAYLKGDDEFVLKNTNRLEKPCRNET